MPPSLVSRGSPMIRMPSLPQPFSSLPCYRYSVKHPGCGMKLLGFRFCPISYWLCSCMTPMTARVLHSGGVISGLLTCVVCCGVCSAHGKLFEIIAVSCDDSRAAVAGRRRAVFIGVGWKELSKKTRPSSGLQLMEQRLAQLFLVL